VKKKKKKTPPWAGHFIRNVIKQGGSGKDSDKGKNVEEKKYLNAWHQLSKKKIRSDGN